MKSAPSKRETMQHKGYGGTAEVSLEDGCLHGRILHIDDLITYEADTLPELQEAFKSAVERYLAHCKAVGKSPNKPYSGSFNVRIGAELHRGLAELSHNCDRSINELVGRAVEMLLEGGRKPGELHVHHKHEVIVSASQQAKTVTASTELNHQIWIASTSDHGHESPCIQ